VNGTVTTLIVTGLRAWMLSETCMSAWVVGITPGTVQKALARSEACQHVTAVAKASGASCPALWFDCYTGARSGQAIRQHAS
jgi:hypothetical protein